MSAFGTKGHPGDQRGLAIDTLINNAGLGDTGRFDQENPERILSMLQVNFITLTELTRLVLPQVVARKRGKVMLLASLAAFQPGPGMAVYYATKSYVLSFGRAIGHELRGTGVTITTLCPGPTTSEFAEVANMARCRFVQRASAGDDSRRSGAPGLCSA